MTMVIVKATTASMLICCEMLSQLRADMKVSGMPIQKNSTTAANPISVP